MGVEWEGRGSGGALGSRRVHEQSVINKEHQCCRTTEIV